jgi:hypothetical protein
VRAERPVKTSVDLFTAPESANPWSRRVAVAFGLAACVSLVGYLLLPRPAVHARAVATQSAPLELLSLRHTQDADGLTVSGVVQNPRGGVAMSHVVATVLLFAADGTFLTNGRAEVDYATLAPGEESPFVIKVPVSGSVARYRVGFRRPDGTVIAHVDRRPADSSARNQQASGSAPWAH